MRRAGLPLAYSQGFTPHPRISMAAPLAIGITSEAEIMDVFLDRWISAQSFFQALRNELPQGIALLETSVIPLDLPSLQSQLRFCEYRVTAGRSGGPADIAAALDKFMAESSITWQHVRDTGVRTYDIRALVNRLWLVSQTDEEVIIGMKLRNDEAGAGRPEQVLAALGFTGPAKTIRRTRLVLEAPSARKT